MITLRKKDYDLSRRDERESYVKPVSAGGEKN